MTAVTMHFDQIAALPPVADEAIDRRHLARMTLGDRSLEREVLQLFVRQTTIMLARLTGAAPPLAAGCAHTLKGSARGIGAWRVARAAERLEVAAANAMDTNAAMDELVAASFEARAFIVKLLRSH
jgi:HPt (histidine-containing phosphotransfer) domain-containing protein